MTEPATCTCGAGEVGQFHARSCAIVTTAAQAPGVRPYVAAPSPVPVRVTVLGVERQGEVIGWRGERVYVRWRSDAGAHLSWVQAGDVTRA